MTGRRATDAKDLTMSSNDAMQDDGPDGRPAADADRVEASVVRSEEALDVTTRTVRSGRVRLRKRVVTSTVTHVVEVRREEAYLERGPAGEGDGQLSGPAGDDEPHDFVDHDYDLILYEEQVVLTRRVVPIERVRLSTRVVLDQIDVSEDIRREEVDLVHEPISPGDDSTAPGLDVRQTPPSSEQGDVD